MAKMKSLTKGRGASYCKKTKNHMYIFHFVPHPDWSCVSGSALVISKTVKKAADALYDHTDYQHKVCFGQLDDPSDPYYNWVPKAQLKLDDSVDLKEGVWHFDYNWS